MQISTNGETVQHRFKTLTSFHYARVHVIFITLIEIPCHTAIAIRRRTEATADSSTILLQWCIRRSTNPNLSSAFCFQPPKTTTKEPSLCQWSFNKGNRASSMLAIDNGAANDRSLQNPHQLLLSHIKTSLLSTNE